MIEARVFLHDDPGLWTLLGPFVADVDVRKELGEHQTVLTSKPGYLWIVLVDAGAVVAFGSVERRRVDYRNSNNYVVPERRREGLYSRLVAEMRLLAGDVLITARCTPVAALINRKHGWVTVGQYGRYTEMWLGNDA